MEKQAVIARVKADGAIAVIRTATSEQALETARAAIDGGFRMVEITYGVPNAAKVIAQLLRQDIPDLIVGAGTVLTPEQVNESVDVGAQFLVSPCVLPDMIAAAAERETLCMPGAFTPTEIYTAHSLGAEIVKIFPAVANGPEYLRALRGPLPHIPIVPTSGVTTANVADWFRAGAFAVGAVGSVLNPALIQNGEWYKLRDVAGEFIAAVARAR